jgi:two-component system sensor histidine kinase TctE
MTTAPDAITSRRSPSLTFRLVAVVTLSLALAATGSLYLAWAYGRQAADDAYDRLLKGASLQIAERVSVSNGEIVVDLPPSAFELLALARNDRIFYRVVGPDGATLTGDPGLPLPPRSQTAETLLYNDRYSGEAVRVAATVRPLAEREVKGAVRVIVAQTIIERTALARDIAVKAAFLIGGASLAILLLALAAVRYALSPLRRVERALRARDPQDLSPLEIETPRELAAMVGAINHFMGRLNRRLAAIETFVADAAHQLRTPITAIRAQAELAVIEADRERLARINRRILARSVTVGRLADQLLSKAMISHRSDTAKRERLDLRRIAIEAESETRSMIGGAGDDIALDLAEDPVLVDGDHFSLREAVKNLVNNARAHGRPPIVLRVGPGGAGARLSVTDAGSGIPPDMRTAIGTRFADSPHLGHGGAGLGLAIVHDVAVFHGGSLACTDTPEGFEIALDLPLAGAAP